MKNSNSISLGLMKSINNDFGCSSIEVYNCRHCNILVKSNTKKIIDAVLCDSCFEVREKYRTENPQSYDVKAERNSCEDRYNTFWLNCHPRAVQCASCKNTYYIVPKDYSPRSLEEQKTSYDMAKKFNEHFGEKIKPFIPIELNLTLSPKGWNNDIICKSCLDEYVISNNSKINEFIKKEKENIAKELEYKKIREEYKIKQAIVESRERESDNFTFKFWLIIFIISIVLFGSKTCVNIEPTELYYRR